MLKQFLEAGRIVGTHGVKGELRVEPWCDSAEFLAKFKTLYWDHGAAPVRILSARPHKNLLLMTVEGCSSATEGDLLRGRVLYLSRGDVKLPAGKYFIQDMIGLSVLDADTGREYGTLTDVLKTGANDVYQVTGKDGGDYLLPVIPDVIIETDLEAGKLLIRPIEGIFEHED